MKAGTGSGSDQDVFRICWRGWKRGPNGRGSRAWMRSTVGHCMALDSGKPMARTLSNTTTVTMNYGVWIECTSVHASASLVANSHFSTPATVLGNSCTNVMKVSCHSPPLSLRTAVQVVPSGFLEQALPHSHESHKVNAFHRPVKECINFPTTPCAFRIRGCLYAVDKVRFRQWLAQCTYEAVGSCLWIKVCTPLNTPLVADAPS